MVREHGSLTKDEETNQAAWEAARGAMVGGTKVSTCFCVSCDFRTTRKDLSRNFSQGGELEFEETLRNKEMVVGCCNAKISAYGSLHAYSEDFCNFHGFNAE
jgi:hypothetical protein